VLCSLLFTFLHTPPDPSLLDTWGEASLLLPTPTEILFRSNRMGQNELVFVCWQQQKDVEDRFCTRQLSSGMCCSPASHQPLFCIY
jgi:hypothetical protein